MMIERRIIIFWLSLMALTNIALAATLPPTPTSDIYVVDYESMIEDDDKSKMLQLGRELERKYRAQIVVVTIETLDGEAIETYANRLFNNWGIGDLIKNNGVLLLIAKNDRQFRIEVGYGLESSITNDYAASVLDGMKEQFRAENYSTAILNAYAQLARKVYEHYGDEPPESLNTIVESEGELTWFETALLVLGIGAFAGSIAVTLYSLYKSFTNSSNRNNDVFYDKHRNYDNDDDDHYGGGSSGGGGASGGW